eukprot:5827147-Amphidinium_carterae.1
MELSKKPLDILETSSLFHHQHHEHHQAFTHAIGFAGVEFPLTLVENLSAYSWKNRARLYSTGGTRTTPEASMEVGRVGNHGNQLEHFHPRYLGTSSITPHRFNWVRLFWRVKARVLN